VVDYLVGKFSGLWSEQFASRGFGRTRPVTTGTDDGSRQRNRRAEFLVLNREKAKREIERKQFLTRGEALPDSLRPPPPIPR
jgi:hypothetical protein